MTAPLHVGFTGTQRGMTDAQGERVFQLLHHRDFYAHHGDCVGADSSFDLIVRQCKSLRGVIIHPPIIGTKRAYCHARFPHDVMRIPKDYLARNEDIVAESDVLIGTPKEDYMQLRSGTWTTIRYALKAGKPIAIVMPNGALVFDGAPWPE